MKHRIIEIILPRPNRPAVGPTSAPPPTGPFTLGYAWALRTLGLKEPITHTVRR